MSDKRLGLSRNKKPRRQVTPGLSGRDGANVLSQRPTIS